MASSLVSKVSVTSTSFLGQSVSTSSSAASTSTRSVVVRSTQQKVAQKAIVAKQTSNEGPNRKPLSLSCGPVAAALSLATAHPALALVDERLSTEGTGLALGLSNAALGWLLAGTFGTIWALYYTFSKGLPEGDDDSGLSL